MEREAVKLQFLGALGIVREAFNILRSSHSKLLWALNLTLVFNLSIAILGQNLIPGPLLLLKIHDKIYHKMEADSPTDERTLRALASESEDLLVIVSKYGAFVFEFWLLSAAAVVYTVASIYKTKEISFGRVNLIVVALALKRLAITLLWFFAIVSTYTAANILSFFLLIYAVGFDKSVHSREFLLGSIPILAVFFCVHLYISTVMHLSSVVSVLEEKYYGLAAMRKSSDLIKGKGMTALALVLLYFIFSQAIGGVFWYAVVEGRSHGVGIAARAVYGALLVGLLCFIMLLGLLTQSVFYFVCKSYHHESIDTSQLEIYNVGDHEPLNSSSTRQHADI